MKKLKITNLINMAKELEKWHHHFLTPNCHFNNSNEYQIIIEDENTNKIYFSNFKNKPMKELEELENLFFKR